MGAGRHRGPGPHLLVGSHIETQNEAGWLDGGRQIALVAGGTKRLRVRGDAALITTAVRNLLDNAIRYSEPRTRVSVGVSLDAEDPDIVRRADGSWLVAGSESADEFANETGFPVPEGDFSTVAGMVLALINRIPRTGDVFSHDGWVVEIADMDAMRIDRLIVTAPATAG